MRILILGGGGMLGHKLWQHFSDRFDDVWVTLRGPKEDYARFGGLFGNERVVRLMDAKDLGSVERVLTQVGPDIIVNCIGVTKRRDCSDPAPVIAINALLPHLLNQWASTHGAKLIQFSTDCVFDGAKGSYIEADRPNAEDLYGRTKALGEVEGPSALTLRLSVIGRELTGGTELLEWFLGQRGKTVRGFRGALYTGITSPTMARLVGEIIEKFPDLNGVYQVASEVISKYDLLLLLRDRFGLDIRVEPDDRFVCKRNLIGERFRAATGWLSPSWTDMCSELASDPTPYATWKARA